MQTVAGMPQIHVFGTFWNFLFNIFNPWLVTSEDAESMHTEDQLYLPQELGLFLFFSPVKLIQKPITSQLNKRLFSFP